MNNCSLNVQRSRKVWVNHRFFAAERYCHKNKIKFKQNPLTYPFWVNVNGTSMLCDDERRRSPAISAKRAKSVSLSWSARRGERRDSERRTSSNFLTSSMAGCNEIRERIGISFKVISWIWVRYLKVCQAKKEKFRSLQRAQKNVRVLDVRRRCRSSGAGEPFITTYCWHGINFAKRDQKTWKLSRALGVIVIKL